MPELPEVETIKRVIEPQIQGLMIGKVSVKRPEIVAYPSADEFCGLVRGQTISCMTRRGKFLIIQLGSRDCIILHLRMTGCLLIAPADCPEEKHTHIVFSLNNGKELRFSDTRRFGRFWLLGKDEADTHSGIAKLGTEPLDKLLTAEYLNARLGQFTRNYMQTVKRAADNKRRYAPGKGHSVCLLWGYPKGAAPYLAHDFAKQSVVCYTLCRRCRENAVAAGEGKGI